jgi:hypothetical protein
MFEVVVRKNGKFVKREKFRSEDAAWDYVAGLDDMFDCEVNER